MSNVALCHENEILELLPWYVNGTLETHERAAVERAASESPQVKAELHWLNDFSQTAVAGRRSTGNSSHGFDENKSLANVLALIDASKAGTLLQFRRPEAMGGVAGSVTRYKAAFAIAAALVAAQSIALFSLTGGNDAAPAARLAPLGASGRVNNGALLQVTFRPAAQEQQIRSTLNAADAEIVSGPGALGVYTVAVPAAAVAGITQFLSDQKVVVERVSLLRAYPQNVAE